MSAARGTTPRTGASLGVDSRLLIVLSTAALVTINLSHLSVATALGALALGAFVIVYLARWRAPRAGLYGFLIAELSPISLEADLLSAVVYQALCLLLLTATVVPLPERAPPRTYARPALGTAVTGAVLLAVGWALTRATWLSPSQAASLSGAGILGMLITVLYVQRNRGPSPHVRGE